ncbi:MAG: FadR/GntR family transcriptional regulator, partial [Pseudonocardia sp.]
ALGIIEIHHGRGSFVALGPGERYYEPFAGWLQVHRDEILDLLKVRGALDELAAAEAAAGAGPAGVAAVEEAHERFCAAAADSESAVDELVRLDIDFHQAIATASGSSLLPRLLAELNSLFTESRRAAFGLPGRGARSAQEHEAIVAGIRAGDPATARAAAATHLESTRSTLGDPAFLRVLAEVTDGDREPPEPAT